ncbi:hypothetical protein MFLO_10443 [Listeria floridensis FSL S10-1187]|uniref:BD-FAE-like domain-containing protein n=1 Tax=Listeria floridensis FSL S10-1187 TaxID=1265817 RepID=A0ABN0RE46_9LIST|nr:alpha/beta hydrolase [Listeria floridensis]EUJ30548.1 hypothetical protein MFLO_10443 [Listeria floridensis FSL S10-1187]
MKQQTFIFGEKDGVSLAADLFTPEKPAGRTVIYFHGGGLLYGSRRDLNESYINQFLSGGFNVLLADYRLAPETKLPEIYQDASDIVLYFTENASKWGLPGNDFALFGQSSGAFLSLLLATDPALPSPFAVLSFYGYSSVSADWLREENDYFNTLPKISESLKNAMIHPNALTSGSVDTRYPLYVYARQSGNWLNLVFGDSPTETDLEPFKLDPERDFHFLPPVFLAHSFADQDVPISESELIKNGTLESELFTVRDLPHDFDTKTADAEGRMAYDAAIRFLNRIY